MMKQFAEIKIYELGGGVAFEEVSESVPFLVLPKGQSTIKSWGTSGFLFENIVTGDVIAFVAEYDDVLDSTGTAYGVDQLAVFTALGGFFFDLGGGGGQDLFSVLANGPFSGPNSIFFESGQGVILNNTSRLKEGTIDAGLGGAKGIAQICAVGYELKWEAGRLYVMDGNGTGIRWSLYNFTNTPAVTDDNTKGYQIGSHWTLDNGTTYVCSDASTGAAVWAIQQIDYLDFNTAAGHTVAEGELAWNDTLGTVNLGLKGGNTISNLGQHIHARVVNKTTPLVALTKAGYEVVIVSGATGQRLSVKLAKADNDANSAGTLGVVCENIAGNQEGFICSVGQLTNINTTGSLQGETWADGDSLYLSPTVFGGVTNVKPSAPFHEVRIGYVEYAHINQGKIYVKIDNGYELDELHNVAITTPLNGNFLEYNGTVWVNQGLVYTIELIAALTVDFYAPYNMKINSVTNILNSPTTTILDDNVAYTLTNTIAAGSKITVTVNTAAVVNLNITKA
jgi:hypothetical protein